MRRPHVYERSAPRPGRREAGDASAPRDAAAGGGPPGGRRYGDDLLAWARDQSGLLAAGLWSQVDAANVAKELEALAAAQEGALEDAYAVVAGHLLCDRLRGPGSPGARDVVAGERARIRRLLRRSPSLRATRAHVLGAAYPDACRLAAEACEVDVGAFPEEPQFGPDEVEGADGTR